jgi:hypothetical protein
MDMSSETLRAKYHADDDDRTAWAVMLATVAGITFALVGVFQFFMGLSAALDDQLYAATPRYVYRLQLTTWGWTLMILGVIGIALGVATLMGKYWGIAGGFVLAIILAIANFLFLPHYPLWGLVQLTFSIAVVWAFGVLLSRSRA